MNTPANRIADWLVVAVLVLPWVHPWAPGPQSNTVPLLIGWGSLASLLAIGRLPCALELAQAWTCAALVSCAIGLLQYFGEAGALGGWVHVPAYLGDAVGNLRQRNQLATLTSMGVVAVLWWHAHGLRAAQATWMIALLALGNAATGSRTGLLQWLFLPVLLGLWQSAGSSRRPVWSWPVLLWGLSVYLAGSLALPHALAAWRGTEISSAMARMGELGGCGSRSVLWANVLHLIGQKPWTGWGWDELKYAHYMATYPGPRFCDILGNAHNLPLQLAFSFGVPVAALLCATALALLLRARPWRLVNSSDSLAWGVLAALGLHSLLEYPLWYGPFQLALLSALALLWTRWPALHARWRPALQTVAASALCVLALIAWDYQRVRQIYLPPQERSPASREHPWEVARQTWFFTGALQFAEVGTTTPTADNAQALLAASLSALHYSPEPRVIDRVIESARLSGQPALAEWHAAQKQVVYGGQRP